MQQGADDLDYRETPDVTQVHGAIQREHAEPVTGTLPVPGWLIVFAMVLIGGAAFYLGAFSGGFSGSVFNERAGFAGADQTSEAAGAAGGAAAAPETLAQLGKKVFAQNCVTCHQLTGLGLPPSFPPLVKSEWVLGSPKRMTMIVLKGLQGPVHVKGQVFNGAMPAWGANLTDKKIAAVLSYVRSEWGNTAGEITPEQVTAVRKELAARAEPWAEADLLAVPADAPAGQATPTAPQKSGPAAPAAAPTAPAAKK